MSARLRCLLRLFKTVLTASALLATAACTTVVGPDYRIPPQAIVQHPAAAAPFAAAQEAAFRQNELPPQWWHLYRDPKLDVLVEKALTTNADLRAAAANLARARAMLDENHAAREPAAHVGASPVYGREAASTLLSPDAFPDLWMYDAKASVSYQLDLFGKLARAIEAAGADAQAARAAYDLARVTVAADTVRAYVNACAAGRQMRVAQHSVELQQQFAQLVEQQIRAGRGTALELSRARAQLEGLKAALPPLQTQQRTALFRLVVLTGDVPGASDASVEQCAQVPQIVTPIPVGDGAALLRRRPDIRQAERSLAAATARIGIATADLYPSISLGLSVGSVGSLAEFGDANTFNWSLGPLISWTLPVTGAARTRIAQAEAGTDAALARFDATVLNALRETESALTAYARELDRNAALAAARDQSSLAAQQAHALYRYGRTDFLAALDTERTLATAESALSASDTQLVNDQVALFLALGGGWEKAADDRVAARQEKFR